MQERLGDVLGSAPGEPESDDEAFEQVRERVQALISAARTLSDTCADLADALRPVPGMAPDDPIAAGFGRLRAERTAALLDEAASAARGTLGLLHSAYGALDNQRARVGPPLPRVATGTWPDAFVEVSSRAFTVDDEAGTAVAQRPWARPASASPDATDPHGIPLVGPAPTPAAATEGDAPAADVASPADGPAETDEPTDTALAAPDKPAETVEPTHTAVAPPDEPTDTAVAAPEPAGTAMAAPEPAGTAMAAPEPAGTAVAATEPAGTAVAATEPAGTAVAAPEPAGTAVAAPEPTGTAVAAPEPTGTAVAAPEPTGTAVAAPEPTGTAVAAPEPTGTAVAAPEPTGTAVAAPEPTETADAAPEPTETAVAAPEPTETADAAPEPTEIAVAAPEADETTDEPTETAVEAPAEQADDAAEAVDATPAAVEAAATAVAMEADEPLVTVDDADLDEAAAALDVASGEAAGVVDASADHAALVAGDWSTGSPVEALAPGLPMEVTPVGEEEPDAGPDDLDGEGLRAWASPARAWAHETTTDQGTADESTADRDTAKEAGTVGEHTRDDIEIQPRSTERATLPEDEHTADDVDGEGLRGWATPAAARAEIAAAALAGWIVVDPDDADDHGHPISERAVAAAPSVDRLTLPVADAEPYPAADPAADPLPGPADDAEPYPAADPVADPLPRPVAEAMPDPVADRLPGPLADLVPGPVADAEPYAVAMPDPVADRLPGPLADLVPGPVADAEPYAVAMPDPVADRLPGPLADLVPDPVDDALAEPPVADRLPGPLADLVPDPVDDAEPYAMAEAMPDPVTDPAADPDGPGWHGDSVSAEPRSLSLVPPVPHEADAPEESEIPMPPAADPWAADRVWADSDLSGAAAFARADRPGWTAGEAVFPAGSAAPAAEPEKPLDEPAGAVLARQVEAARRHLQAALVVANGPEAPRQLGALLTAIEQVLTAVTDLARETRGLLESGLGDRTFPGEARFLCSPPWDGTNLVGRDAYGDDVATPAGLAKLLRALGYEAHSVTSAGGVTGVQIRSQRYAMQVALVEPAGGGRQRWSGALEWVDESGADRTWAETLGPVELEDEELARRVDELLRRSVGG